MITDVDAVGMDIAFESPFPTSHVDHGPTRHVFVRIKAGEHIGYGEGTALTWFTGETSETMESVVRELLIPKILDRSSSQALALVHDVASRLPNNPGATTAVEMALLDLRGKELGVPVAELLGPRYRDSVPCGWASGALPPETVADAVENAYNRGFRTFKIKADGHIDRDVDRIDAVTGRLEMLGADNANVRVDANTGWKRYERAYRAIDQMKRKHYIEYFEQPLPVDRLDAMTQLRYELAVPVFADEFVHDTDDVREIGGEPPALSGFCAKLAKTGSIRDIGTMGELAADDGLPVTLVSAFESSLGVAADLHLGATIPELSSAAELGSGLLNDDPVVESLQMEPSTPVPDGPGLGVELDPALFEE